MLNTDARPGAYRHTIPFITSLQARRRGIRRNQCSEDDSSAPRATGALVNAATVPLISYSFKIPFSTPFNGSAILEVLKLTAVSHNVSCTLPCPVLPLNEVLLESVSAKTPLRHPAALRNCIWRISRMSSIIVMEFSLDPWLSPRDHDSMGAFTGTLMFPSHFPSG